MTVSVSDVLNLPLMREAQVVAGEAGLDMREVRWVAVIEGPVEDFVDPGELILSSGMGRDGEGLRELIAELVASGAAAMCIGVGPQRFFEEIGDLAKDIADRNRFPLIEIPWGIRFADVTRATVDLILADRHGPLEAESGSGRFTHVVLDGLGFKGVADMLESVLPRAVVILDGDLRPQAFGRRAEALLGERGIAACRSAGENLTLDEAGELGRLFAAEAPRSVPGLGRLGLGPGLGMMVTAQGAVVAHVHAMEAGEGEPRISEFDALILSQAAEAVAMEAARRRAAAEAEARVRGHFLWGLASGSIGPDIDVATDASLLGYDARAEYHVGLLQSEERERVPELERRLIRQAGSLGAQPHTARQGSQLLLLVEAGDRPEGVPPELLARLRAWAADSQWPDFSAGIARGGWRLGELASAYAQAKLTLNIGRALTGPGRVAEAAELAPFLMISHLADDPQAKETAITTLGALIDYDQRTGRGLLETLEAYLDEGGNASRTARRLFLSRHSLLYRIGKIEQLTGHSLESRDDRFVVELSLRLVRFGVLDHTAESL